MNRSLETTKTEDTSVTADVINLARYYLGSATSRARPYLGGRRGLVILAVAALGAGAALNWSWLVAIGVAPILLTLAPCAAMCALGLCMGKSGSKSCSSSDQSTNVSEQKSGSTKPREDA